MKEKRTTEITICDFCKKTETYDQCLCCHKDVCWECKKTRGVDYQHAVFFSGSEDGFYCTSCDMALSEGRGNARHEAFVAIRRLRDEYSAWTKDFEKRKDAAESRLASLRESTNET